MVSNNNLRIETGGDSQQPTQPQHEPEKPYFANTNEMMKARHAPAFYASQDYRDLFNEAVKETPRRLGKTLHLTYRPEQERG